MVKNVSEDTEDNTIEFNEFLVMISKYKENEITEESLMAAFKYFKYIILNSLSNWFKGAKSSHERLQLLN